MYNGAVRQARREAEEWPTVVADDFTLPVEHPLDASSPMYGRLGAPFGGEAAYGLVDLLAVAEEIADDAAVEEGAVGVGVGEVGGQKVLVAELVEDLLSRK